MRFGETPPKAPRTTPHAFPRLGLLRVDAAYPLERRDGDRRYQLYFGFGNAF